MSHQAVWHHHIVYLLHPRGLAPSSLHKQQRLIGNYMHVHALHGDLYPVACLDILWSHVSTFGTTFAYAPRFDSQLIWVTILSTLSHLIALQTGLNTVFLMQPINGWTFCTDFMQQQSVCSKLHSSSSQRLLRLHSISIDHSNFCYIATGHSMQQSSCCLVMCGLHAQALHWSMPLQEAP